MERYAHSTANRILSALRGALRAAWKLELMNAEDYRRAISVENVRGETVPAGRAAQSDEIKSILQTCEQSSIGVRDAAMLALLYGAGLRRAELVALNVDDYFPRNGWLRAQGKGNKERMAPASAPGVVAALPDWLAVRGRALCSGEWVTATVARG